MALGECSEPHRLTREMRSRKLQALDFIKRYFAQWGHSPTLGELAAALDISTKRAYDLVHQLAEKEMIQHEAGKTRGIRLIERSEELSEADVLLRLSAMGWTIGQGFRVIMPPRSSADAQTGAAIIQGLMEKGLPKLDYIADDPDGTEGTGNDGRTQPRRARGGRARAAGAGEREAGF